MNALTYIWCNSWHATAGVWCWTLLDGVAAVSCVRTLVAFQGGNWWNIKKITCSPSAGMRWDLFWNKWNGKTKERQEDWPFGRSTKPKIRMKWCILQWGRWHHARLSSQWNLYELGGALAQNHSFIFFYKTCKKRNLQKYWSVTSVKLCEDKTISSIIWTSTWCLLIFTALFFSYRFGASDFAMFTITLGIYSVYFIL